MNVELCWCGHDKASHDGRGCRACSPLANGKVCWIFGGPGRNVGETRTKYVKRVLLERSFKPN